MRENEIIELNVNSSVSSGKVIMKFEEDKCVGLLCRWIKINTFELENPTENEKVEITFKIKSRISPQEYRES